MPVTSAPFGSDYLRSKGCRIDGGACSVRPGPPAGRRPGRPRPAPRDLSEALPAWEHQRRGRARIGGTHGRDHRAAIGGTQQRGNGGRDGRAHQRGNGARGGRAHQQAGATVVGGTHERDRWTSLTGSAEDEPGLGDLRDLGVWVRTAGIHHGSFPLTGPTPGVQSCGWMALLVGLGGHELAGEHGGGALAGARPVRRLLERTDDALPCLLLRAGYFHRARDAGRGATAARGAAVSGPAADGGVREALASADTEVMCRANSSGTPAVGTSASGSSVSGTPDGVTLSSWNPVRAPRVRATTRSVMPNALNHRAARRPVPRASLYATNGAAIPVEMSPRPAGRANSAGRWPRAR